MTRFALLFTALLALAAPAAAQTTSPYRAQFTASSSHSLIENGSAVLSHYELHVYAPGQTTVTATEVNMGKPSPDASNVITVDVNAALTALPASSSCNPTTPTAQSCYTAKVIAVGPGGRGESALSPPFHLGPRSPSPAGQPTIRRQ